MITSSLDPDKIEALRQRQLQGRSTAVIELLAVYWPSPDRTTYYGCMPWMEASNCAALQARIGGFPYETRFAVSSSANTSAGQWFRDVEINSGIADTVVNLDFVDFPRGAPLQRDISKLFLRHGEGVKCEIFYYFPDVDLMASIWWGHLQAPDSVDGLVFKASAASGFRSLLMNLPKRIFVPFCTALFPPSTPSLNTLPLIAVNDCRYDRHLGGINGLLDSNGQPFLTCPKLRSSCIQRWGDIPTLPWLGFDLIPQPFGGVYYGQPHTINTTNGNSSNLQNPLRVVIGDRIVRALDTLQYTTGVNPDHPDRGSLLAIFAGCEGPIEKVYDDKVQLNNIYAPKENVQIRLGTVQQTATGRPELVGIISIVNYSSTVIINVTVKGDFRTVTFSQVSGSAHILGLNNIVAYTDENTFTTSWTNGQNPAWALFECIKNKRWGLGEDPDRYVISDFIALGNFSNQIASFTDTTGAVQSGTRSVFNADMSGRSVQDQIKDICLFREYTPPFPYEGKWRIMPLTKEVLGSDIPYFKDFGPDRNIMWDGDPERSTLTWKRISSRVLPNQITLQFDDHDNFDVTRPLLFVDEGAQLEAGESFGDNTFRVLPKTYSALGVTHFVEASRMGNRLLDLGEFHSGGLKNPITIKFNTTIQNAIGLHKYSVIKVDSTNLTEVYNDPNYGFYYYRITGLRMHGWWAEIDAVAYPEQYLNEAEAGTQIVRPGQPVGGGPTGGGGGGGGGNPGDPPGKIRIFVPEITDDGQIIFYSRIY